MYSPLQLFTMFAIATVIACNMIDNHSFKITVKPQPKAFSALAKWFLKTFKHKNQFIISLLH